MVSKCIRKSAESANLGRGSPRVARRVLVRQSAERARGLPRRLLSCQPPRPSWVSGVWCGPHRIAGRRRAGHWIADLLFTVRRAAAHFFLRIDSPRTSDSPKSFQYKLCDSLRISAVHKLSVFCLIQAVIQGSRKSRARAICDVCTHALDRTKIASMLLV